MPSSDNTSCWYFAWSTGCFRLVLHQFYQRFLLMAPHSSTLPWKSPWTEEPGGLQSMGLQRVGHDWATSLSLPFLLSRILEGILPTYELHKPISSWHSFWVIVSFQNKLCMFIMHHQDKTAITLSTDLFVHVYMYLCVYKRIDIYSIQSFYHSLEV